MEKYWIRKNSTSNEVGLIFLNENQLENIEHWKFDNENFVKPIVFNDEIIEGATQEEIEQFNKIIVPETITAIPFFVQLELMGITESDVINKIEILYKAGILNEQERVEALVSVRRANIFERNHPFIALIANAFEISKEQVDQIFINGNKL